MSLSKDSAIYFSDLESKAEVGSSKIKMRGSLKIALAIAIRCFWPVESLMPLQPTIYLYFLEKDVRGPKRDWHIETSVKFGRRFGVSPGKL